MLPISFGSITTPVSQSLGRDWQAAVAGQDVAGPGADGRHRLHRAGGEKSLASADVVYGS